MPGVGAILVAGCLSCGMSVIAATTSDIETVLFSSLDLAPVATSYLGADPGATRARRSAVRVFVPENSVVSSVVVYGLYPNFSGSPSPPPEDDFRLILYQPAEPYGLRNASPIADLSLGEVPRVDTGRTLYPELAIFEYSLVLPDPVTLSAEHLWISVSNDTGTEGEAPFAWLAALRVPGGRKLSIFSTADDGDSWSVTLGSFAAIMEVRGSIVPEPSVLVLILVGAPWFGGLRRR